MRQPLGLLLLAGCRLGFDGRDTPDASSAVGDTCDTNLLAFVAPAEGAQVVELTLVTGACSGSCDVSVTGDLVAPVMSPCTAGMFATYVRFNAGDGDKAVTITQGAESATRHFIRVSPAVSFRSAATGSIVSQGANVDCTLAVGSPAGVGGGDLLLAMIYTDGSVTTSINTTGWTRLSLQAGPYVAMYRTAGGAEPAAYLFPIVVGMDPGATCESAGVIGAFVGANQATPIEVERDAVLPSAVDLVAPSASASQLSMIVALYGSNGPSTGYTPPPEMITASTAASPGDWASALLAYQPVFPGPTGTRTATIAQARAAATALLVLR